MSIKEKALNMSVWKAAAIGMISLLSVIFVIESMVVHKVFSILNGSITHFEKLFKEDDDDFNTDLREFDESQEYSSAMSDYTSAQHGLSIYATPQEIGCHHLVLVKQLKNMLELSYVKHQQYAHDFLVKEISAEQAAFQDAIDKHELDPNKCVETI